MNHQMLIVFGVLAVAVALFVLGRPRADVIGILVVAALMATGVLTPTEALAGFGSPVVILLAAMFIVSAGLVNTGVTQRLAEFIVRVGGSSETRLVALIMLVAGVVGSVLNSAAIVVIFIPVVLAIAEKTGLNSKRMLMPLCVAVMISGMMTLIASSPNIIIENVLRERGISPSLGFFSFSPFGVIVLGIGIVFMLLLGRRLLSRERTGEAGTDSPHAADLIKSYGLQMRWHHVRPEAGSPLLGQSSATVRPNLEQRYGAEFLGLEKHADGAVRFLPPQPEAVIEEGDVLFVLVDDDRADDLSTDLRCQVMGPPLPDQQRGALLQHLGVAEVMAAPDSASIGKSLQRLDFPRRYDLAVLGVRHRGVAFIDQLASRKVDFGDTLLVGGNWDDITRLSDDRRNFILLSMPAEYEQRLSAPGRANVAVGILLAMVVVMAFGWLPISGAALIAALAMLATGCVSVDSIYTSMSWTTLVLIAGMLPLATALTKTGATTLMATHLVKALGLVSPTAMLVVVFLITALLCLFISNAATAVIFAPVAIDAARTLHVSPQAFAMTVAIACSAAFVTPVSSPTNMLVMEPGGYRPADYAKVGVPMLILTMVVTVGLAKIVYLSG